MPAWQQVAAFWRHLRRCGAGLLVFGALAACTPRYDWREVRGTDEPFTVLLPAKPTSSARPVRLDGRQLMMRMTVAQVDGITFAVGSATVVDAEAAPAALHALKSALVGNIHGTIRSEAASAAAGSAGTRSTVLAVEADGSLPAGGQPQPAYLKARFVARERRVYQVVILSRGQPVAPELAEPFFSSFKTGD